jgi:hypothetical protein
MEPSWESCYSLPFALHIDCKAMHMTKTSERPSKSASKRAPSRRARKARMVSHDIRALAAEVKDLRTLR